MDKRELQDRTKKFALRVIRMSSSLPKNVAGRTISGQIVRSATSVAANYRATCRGRSRAEFTSKLGIVLEESDETQFWLEIILEGELLPSERLSGLIREAAELTAIFTSASRTLNSRGPKIPNEKFSITHFMTLGFIGLGRMGANMARHLKDKGWKVSAVYDIRPDVTAELASELGAVACGKLSDVTRESDVIVTVVTDDAAMRGIFGLDGAADHLLHGAKGKTFINCATISPQVHIDVETAANAAGAQSLEACMASSITQAREGTLYLMVAGETKVFQSVEPVLKDLSGALRHVGKTGEAAKVKALVNMVMNINTAGLAEGLGLGDALGLDLTVLREVFSQTGANSRVLQTDGEDMQNRDHACFFSASHAAKDSGIALGLAKEVGVNLPLAAATKAQYDRMVQAGLGELDKSGIAELTFKGRGAS